jgi:hypothetical protein
MDHTVPYGTVLSVDAFPLTSCQATIMLSLWDEIHLRAEALIKKALMGLKPWAEPPVPFGTKNHPKQAFFVPCRPFRPGQKISCRTKRSLLEK